MTDQRTTAIERAQRAASDYREAIAVAEAGCSVARGEYVRALRQATAAGISRRALAQALGISPQRIQQILGARNEFAVVRVGELT